jgi:predicted acetyltransferase
MEYRMLRPAEVASWRRYQEYCFTIPRATYEPLMARFRHDLVRGIFRADGEMLAALTNIPYELWIDGAKIGMGGIASVVAPPEHRRGGNVGRLLTECIRETYEQGLPLSGLFPFKASFYRAYGWEVASVAHVHTIPLEVLAPYRRQMTGEIARHLPTQEDWREIVSVYTPYAQQRRGYMVRPSQQHYSDWVNPPWRDESGQWTAAVWRSAAGAAPEGYLLYRIERHEGKVRMLIKELVGLTQARCRAFGASWHSTTPRSNML